MLRISRFAASCCLSLILFCELGCGIGQVDSTKGALLISPDSASLLLDQTAQMHANFSYIGGSVADVTSIAAWSTATSTVAEIDVHGLLTCKSPGPTRITALSNGIVGVASITCSVPQLVIGGLSPLELNGHAVQMQATISYLGGPSKDITSTALWSTTAPAIATVDPQGVLTCKSPGFITITAAANGASGLASTTCFIPQISISGISRIALVGQPTQIQASVSYPNGLSTDVTSAAAWSSAVPAIVMMDSHGLLTCKSSGLAQIKASYNGGNGLATVDCSEAASSLSIVPAILSVRVSSPVQLSAIVTDKSGNNISPATVQWAASSSLLSVTADGILSCISAGSATVSAYYPPITHSETVSCSPDSLNTPSYYAEASDEFVGPFASWTNIKTTFAAIGDGQADDTAAIQKALDSLNQPGTSSVLWLPAGTYKITKPLIITHKQAFSLIGEDPTTTELKWAGPAGGTIMETDASTYFRISRLSFDGSGLADTAENITSLTTDPGGYYSTFNELSDQQIRGVAVGIRLGADAETTVERVMFDHISEIGLSVETFNTLNIFINDSLFLNCGTGISNTLGAGSFIVANSFFKGSQISDMSIGNTGYFTARHNTSVSSTAFFIAYQIGANNGTITLQNNTVLDPQTSPFQLGDLGPMMLIDNVVRMQDSSVPVVQGNYDWTATKDVFSFGNIFTPNPGPLTYGGSVFQGRFESYDDSITLPSTIRNVQIPADVYVPSNYHRTTYEVAEFTGVAIQNAINQAVASGSPNAVVHLPDGEYQVGQTIVIPSRSDVQLIGDDSNSTILSWSGISSGPVIKIGTSNASIKNLRIVGNTSAPPGIDGILLSLADQPNTELIVDQAQLQGENAYSVNFDGIEHLDAELFSTYTQGSITGINVLGGPFRAAKEGTLGVTNHYTGSLQSAPDATSFSVSSDGKFMVQDNWHDGGLTGTRNFILASSGTVTEQTGVVAINSTTPFEIDNFDGKITLIGLQFHGGFLINPGNKKTNLLNLGLVGASTNYLPSSVGSTTVNSILNSYYDSSGGGHVVQQDNPETQWLRGMLAQTRSEYPVHRRRMTNGGYRIRLSRIEVQNTASALHIVPELKLSGLYYSISAGSSQLIGEVGSCVSATGNSSAATHWLLLPAGDGDYQIAPAGSDSVLGLSSPSATTEVPTLERITGAYSQRWLIRSVGDGRFALTNRATGQLLSSSVSTAGCVEVVPDTPLAHTAWSLTAH